ncbi:RuBisCO accumulation factor 1 [Rubidibacter lacunae]|uniref:RuBisCO accumulation factor 1 n=1 Tax=Rubidibacter lacunae TaxID=582514 RepID=UPI00040C07C6|nr:RuBisCO accumulation factor 1 [Rubidibacter lacunae]
MPVVNLGDDPAGVEACPRLEPTGPFGIAAIAGGRWVALPGWKSLLNAVAPLAVACTSEELPEPPPGRSEPVLVVVDRAGTNWSPDGYFLCEREGALDLQWFEVAPEIALLGRVLFVLRPKRIIDEDAIATTWDLDE